MSWLFAAAAAFSAGHTSWISEEARWIILLQSLSEVRSSDLWDHRAGTATCWQDREFLCLESRPQVSLWLISSIQHSVPRPRIRVPVGLAAPSWRSGTYKQHSWCWAPIGCFRRWVLGADGDLGLTAFRGSKNPHLIWVKPDPVRPPSSHNTSPACAFLPTLKRDSTSRKIPLRWRCNL